ncbi:MAG: hypothetical protein IV092_21210 [Burkholderiaceae bacterium]|nr:hypothetical protein [Burkholderiaceae bacterium]
MMVDRTLATRQLSRSEAGDRRAAEPPAASVWQREMEKAQAQMWFKEATWQEGPASAAEQAGDGRSPVSSSAPAKPLLAGRDAPPAAHHTPSGLSEYHQHVFALPEPQAHSAIEARRVDQDHPVDSPRLTHEPSQAVLIARTEVAAAPQQDRRSPVARHTSHAVNTAQSAPHLESASPADRARPDVAATASKAKQATSQILGSRSAAPAVAPGAQTMPVQPHARAMSRPAELLRRTDTKSPDTEPRPPDKAPDPTTSRPSARASIEPQQALRLHAEYHGDEIHVWVGKDGRVNLSHTQLRRWVGEALVPAQLRLASLTCNGIPISIDGKSVSRGRPDPTPTTDDGRPYPTDEQVTQDRGASRWPT